MDSQLFYLLNFIFAGVFLIWFFAGRKGPARPTVLNLRAPDKDSSAVLQPDHLTSPGNQDYPVKYTPRAGRNERDVTQTKSQAEVLKKSAALPMALFLYNGHDWNAYEVLGVNADSTLPQITAKYQFLVKNSKSQGQHEFLETAYKALLKKF